MTAEILTALISGGSTLLVCLVSNYFSNSKTQALIEYRLKELEEKVDKHNNLVERMYACEEKLAKDNLRLESLEKE